MLYQLSYASLHGATRMRHTKHDSISPAGTNIELNTTALRRASANRWISNHFAKTSRLNSLTPPTDELGILQSALAETNAKMRSQLL